jgi:hypothetical protein
VRGRELRIREGGRRGVERREWRRRGGVERERRMEKRREEKER